MSKDDKKPTFEVVKPDGNGAHIVLSLDAIKSAFIVQGMGVDEIAKSYMVPVDYVKGLVEEHKLADLRQSFIKEGLGKLQNTQIEQAQKLMDIELNFKKLRILQLEKELQEYAGYYAKHGDFYKRHPVSGEIMRNTDGIAMQLRVPNVAKEIRDLKETVTLSEGLKKLLAHIDDIINPPESPTDYDEDDVIDMQNIDDLFKKNP